MHTFGKFNNLRPLKIVISLYPKQIQAHLFIQICLKFALRMYFDPSNLPRIIIKFVGRQIIHGIEEIE